MLWYHESCQGLLQGPTGVITRMILMKTIIVFPPVEGSSSNVFYLTLTLNCRKLVFCQWVKKKKILSFWIQCLSLLAKITLHVSISCSVLPVIILWCYQPFFVTKLITQSWSKYYLSSFTDKCITKTELRSSASHEYIKLFLRCVCFQKCLIN